MGDKYNVDDVVIRPARKEDMVAVAALFQELANSQNLFGGPKITVKELQRDGFESQPPAFLCCVAEFPHRAESPIVGYALYFPTYSRLGRAMLLENLYVRASERRRGIGEKLFSYVAKEAASSGCTRLDFHVLEWNDARTFYEGKGAVNLTRTEQWCYYRLAGDALRTLAAKE